MVSLTTKKLEKRRKALRTERSSFIPVYQELSDYHLSYRGRFLTSDRNKGHKRNTKQYNNTSTLAIRTLSSGMMAGITSPARPWFRLGPPAIDPEMIEYAPVREWLFRVQQLIYAVFSHSNFYNSMHSLYKELGTFGTASMGVYQDFNDVIWCQVETVGSYTIAANPKGLIDTRYYECQKTVAQLVREYGFDNCSKKTQDMWTKGNTEAWVDIVHAVEPNDNRDRLSPLARDMAYRSVHYELGCSDEHKFLRRSGFKTFPIMVPRWDLVAGDVYATSCPGMDALGDAKELQLGHKRFAQARDKVTNPLLQGPPELRNAARGNMQGSEVVWVDQAGGGINSVYGNWRPELQTLEKQQMDTEQRIKRAFYEDLFLMMSQSDRRNITAREVAERHEEKLLMLGPVLERLHDELLDPIIERTFDILQGAGVLPPPPPELADMELKVEYVSILAQAQRLVATTGVERVAAFAGELSGVWPEARHKINPMQAIDEYAEAVGIPPSMVRSDDEAMQLMAAEQQQAQAQQALEQAQQAASAAQAAAHSPTDDGNLLSEVMSRAGLA